MGCLNLAGSTHGCYQFTIGVADCPIVTRRAIVNFLVALWCVETVKGRREKEEGENKEEGEKASASMEEGRILKKMKKIGEDGFSGPHLMKWQAITSC